MFVQLLMQEGETLLLKAWNGLSHWVSELKISKGLLDLALKEKIDAELDKLIEQKVLEAFSHPVFATLIVTPV
ncbi:hypothetical protein T4E_253 [Trichinella pseudospiralis]|uniref:Uncharacterized protein n=1 Tax=Trichinella pseudospiralis TaxID=6337 RepID=A0A0V0YEG0_TRIPS|nr:hypothetical protein T4E_253 [Trichinella pseudospiralis]